MMNWKRCGMSITASFNVLLSWDLHHGTEDLYVYHLFNNTSSISDYIVLYDSMIVNNEFGKDMEGTMVVLA
jgi:hypothetical protein